MEKEWSDCQRKKETEMEMEKEWSDYHWKKEKEKREL